MKTTSVFAKLLKLIRRVKKKEVKSELNIRCSFFKIQKATLKQRKRIFTFNSCEAVTNSTKTYGNKDDNMTSSLKF